MNRIPSDYIERCYAGWLGKVIGVRLGAPIEGWSYERIQKELGEPRDYIVDYRDFAADDDTNGPMFFMRALNDYTHTRDITAEQIGLTWLNYAPYEHGFYWWGGYGKSTEHTAYLNLRAGIMAPRSGSVEQNGAAVAEQIGGQIFIDTWGLVVPNDPALAAEYAGKAASVSHGGNGIYGGQFVAAAISAAFADRDIKSVLKRALAQIPEDCEYAVMARDIWAYYDANKASGWRNCMEYIIANWGYDRYPGVCHIIPNSAVMIMSMLYGEGDFSDTINICNLSGWDTDCNVGNVGAIIGTVVGLEGIDYRRWRAPINDFMVASSVIGCKNIMNLPDCVREIANMAYKIAGETPPMGYVQFLDGGYGFDFELPGSTYAFRTRGEADAVAHEDDVFETGTGGLRVTLGNLGAGDVRYAYHGTYYRPKHFHDHRYDPAFSPILYPGQTVSVRVRTERAGLSVCAYALDSNADKEYLGDAVALVPGQWATAKIAIPALSGACIEQAGIRIECTTGDGGDAALFVDHMAFTGKADYTLDYAKERMEVWAPLRREVSQMTYLKGIWDIKDGKLLGTCADYGEAYTGDTNWGDVEISCRWTPDMTLGRTGFLLRTQGAIRGYAVFADRGTLSICKNENGYRMLASCPLPVGDALEFTARARGNVIEVMDGGRVLLSVTDKENPYLHGMTGLSVRDGGHACYEWLRVKVL